MAQVWETVIYTNKAVFHIHGFDKEVLTGDLQLNSLSELCFGSQSAKRQEENRKLKGTNRPWDHIMNNSCIMSYKGRT